MVEKRDIRVHVEAALGHYNRAGAALYRALRYVETEDFEESTGDLQECSELLVEAIAETRAALEVSKIGLETGLIRKGGEELESERTSAQEAGELVFENLRRKGELERLFYDDPESWKHLEIAAIANDPLAGYTRFASFMSRLRNSVDGLREDVENGEPDDHLLFAGWRASTEFMHTKNFIQMLEYVNRETR